MEKLKNCPFCNGVDNKHSNCCWIILLKRGSSGENISMEQLRKAWNIRPRENEMQAKLDKLVYRYNSAIDYMRSTLNEVE